MKWKGLFVLCLAMTGLWVTGCSDDEVVSPAASSQGVSSVSGGTSSSGNIVSGSVSSATSSSVATLPGYDVYVCGAEANDAYVRYDYFKNGIGMQLGTLADDIKIKAMTVADGHVYFAGRKDEKAAYWKDGVLTFVDSTLGESYSYVNSIYVNGTDVYLAGTSHLEDYATWWKNGVATVHAGKGEISSIAVLGADVYYCTGGKFFKNGIENTLINTGTCHAVVVAGVDVYVVGQNAAGKPAYWKNGIETALDGSGSASALAVSGPDVYVAGNDGKVVRYWKNGVAVNLTDGVQQWYATGIAVSGSDVHVIGESSYLGDNVCGYWKNGVEQALFADYEIRLCTVFASGTDVYLPGLFAKGTLPYNKTKATYWKNGSAITLTDGSTRARANSIAVSGEDVYVAGREENGSGVGVAKYWKNGTAVNLSDGTQYGDAYSIFVSGPDVYVAGSEESASYSVAKYWKNGTAVNLTDGTKSGFAISIFVSGPDVYVAGSEGNTFHQSVAKYWKNGTAVSLTDGTRSAQAAAITVVGTDVYVAGHEDAGSYISIAKYWKNGTAVSLTDGTRAARATAIAVEVVAGMTNIYVAGYIKGANDPEDRLVYWKNGTLFDLGYVNDAAVCGMALSDGHAFFAGYGSDAPFQQATYWYDSAVNKVLLGSGMKNSIASGIFVVKK